MFKGFLRRKTAIATRLLINSDVRWFLLFSGHQEAAVSLLGSIHQFEEFASTFRASTLSELFATTAICVWQHWCKAINKKLIRAICFNCVSIVCNNLRSWIETAIVTFSVCFASDRSAVKGLNSIFTH